LSGDKVSYPEIVDYHAVVQDPRNTFTDAELKTGAIAKDPSGLPSVNSGGSALTYTVHSGQKKYAVRCFKRELPQAQNRYGRISASSDP
jgi:hypothetical protein